MKVVKLSELGNKRGRDYPVGPPRRVVLPANDPNVPDHNNVYPKVKDR